MPESLPAQASIVWTADVSQDGVGGIAVAEGLAIVSTRDVLDTRDVYLAFDAETGKERWRIDYDAPGDLDYGNSPRATPLMEDGKAFLLGAMGHLTAVDLETGLIAWQIHLAQEFQTPKLPWGLTGSPLVVSGKLIVQPGGEEACLAALDPGTGKVLWKSPGARPGHASFIAASLAGQTQIVGYDERSLGGWDPDTGRRLWTVVPRLSGDFNVPTPILLEGDRIFVATENNGARIYQFDAGNPSPKQVARNGDLAPDSHSPVASGGRIYGVCDGLRCLDARTLEEIWNYEDDAFFRYASLIVAGRRLLAMSEDAQLILLEDAGQECRELGRLRLTEEDVQVLSHPALVGTRLFARVGESLMCIELSAGK